MPSRFGVNPEDDDVDTQRIARGRLRETARLLAPDETG
jgi:hypothetical protein